MFESATDYQIHMTCYTYSMYPMESNLHQLIREVLIGQITLVSEIILVPNWPVSYLIKANVWAMRKFQTPASQSKPREK